MTRKYTPEERERFWSKVDKSGGDDACWFWTACVDNAGYGQIKWQRRTQKAHRIAYKLTYGSIPNGLFVCHSCDIRTCCNPAHLWLGTNQDNMDDMLKKGRDVNPQGEQHGRCKLTADQVREIRHRYSNGETNKSQLGREYGVSDVQIDRIVKRQLWAHLEIIDPVDNVKQLTLLPSDDAPDKKGAA